MQRRPQPREWFGASPHVDADPMRSLWATASAYRIIALAYALYIHSLAVGHYEHPHVAGMLIALQCIWTGAGAIGLYTWPRTRACLVAADQLVTVGLMYATWLVAPQSWWDHNQSLPTTLWVVGAVLAAGMEWGAWAGFGSAVALALVSLHVGGDLSWLERSPTLPVFLSAGLAAGFGGSVVRRSHVQLQQAIELRARAAERDRLAREVHDGVLQVLALMGRRGVELGGEMAELGRAAVEQERALRALIAERDDAVSPREEAREAAFESRDLRRELLALGSERVRVSAGSDPVVLEDERARELMAAVRQALANIAHHAGEQATAFVLLEDLGEEIVVTVRDDGVGIAPGRLEEAQRAGRMGVSGSIIGRLEALGGRARLESEPGEGTEWELTLPR